MNTYFIALLLLWVSLVTFTKGHLCDNMANCRDCIRTSGCGWCLESENEDGPKCQQIEELMSSCHEKYQENPQTVLEIIKSIPVESRSRSKDNELKVVQIEPQKLGLQLRVGVHHTIEFKFKKAHDYPLDLYYLMDVSKSMHEYKNRLSQLGDTLSTLMQNLTSSFQLGFGTFVDKVALPFTNIAPDYITQPCDGCVPAYSYKNDMSLNQDTSIFSKKLQLTQMSGNMDTPEGGFDGLLQAIVCTKELNWREKARRILVLCTDGESHIAGDGKLGGVVEPHDGKCHLNPKGEYTEGLKYDYPSISLINAKAMEQSINIIFAVTKQHLGIYSKLQNAIEGASVGVLERSESIVSLVHEQYKSMSLMLTMTHNATESINIALSTKCPGEDWINKKSCNHLQGGDEVYFRLNIAVTDCSTPKQTIEVKPIGIAESLSIDLEVLCDCNCAKPSSMFFEENSEKCLKRGNLTCGLCQCNSNYYGSQCECFRGRSYSLPDQSHCRKNNVTCSGRGDCICGTCSCHQPANKSWRVSGKYCECDNYACAHSNGLLCSGHGVCNCGTCVCDPGWTGHSCACSLDTKYCTTENGSLCSGRGSCDCGKCVCNIIPGKWDTTYSGEYCEKCTICKVECTQEMHDCVDCLVHKTGPYVSLEQNCSHCAEIFANYTLIDDSFEMLNLSESSTLCRPLENDENKCFFKYVAYYHNEEIWIYADESKTCPKEANIIAIALGVAGSTVLAGIIFLLVWKVATTIHDKREFAKFEKERANSKWGRADNPLYRKAVSTYANPIYKEE